MTETLRIGRRAVRISHPDKVLFPRAKVTKLALARHFERVAPVMLPYVAGRPLALQGFPGGIDKHGYYLKAVPDYFPDWVGRATVAKQDGTVTHALANDAATLVYLAGQNVVTPHLWLSRADAPRQPDRLILASTPRRRVLRTCARRRAMPARACATLGSFTTRWLPAHAASM